MGEIIKVQRNTILIHCDLIFIAAHCTVMNDTECCHAIRNKIYVGTEKGIAIIDQSTNKVITPNVPQVKDDFICMDFFVYKDEIYFFGGYGLFTTKNILTKFDFNLKEWILVDLSNENNSPYLTDAYSIKLNDNFYVFGGYKSVNSQIIDNKDYVYCLDLKNYSWKKTKTNFGV